MTSIKILMKDGTVKEFPHEGRAGGSYTKSVRYEPGFVVVTDEWDNEVAVPISDVVEVQTSTTRRWW